MDAALPGILEDATTKLSGAVRLLLAQLKVELDQLVIRLEEADTLIKKIAQESEVCRRLDAIPGIGPLTATALIAAIGNGEKSSCGEQQVPGVRVCGLHVGRPLGPLSEWPSGG